MDYLEARIEMDSISAENYVRAMFWKSVEPEVSAICSGIQLAPSLVGSVKDGGSHHPSRQELLVLWKCLDVFPVYHKSHVSVLSRISEKSYSSVKC